MSYVLEALRRAEAERHRGRVPGLDAQPLPDPQAGLAVAGTSRPRWILPAVGGSVASLMLLAWWLWPGAVAPPADTPAPAALRAAPPAAPAPPLAAVAPRPPVVRPPAPRRPASAPPVAAEGRILRLQDLPEATRRQIPPLAFGGATDSPEPAARMLIVNGQVFREGDEPAPGLTLERITLRSAQFRWRGQRFEAAY